jgi:hypothetical protein
MRPKHSLRDTRIVAALISLLAAALRLLASLTGHR